MEVPIGTKVKVPFEIDTRKGNILYKGTVTEKGKAEVLQWLKREVLFV